VAHAAGKSVGVPSGTFAVGGPRLLEYHLPTVSVAVAGTLRIGRAMVALAVGILLQQDQLPMASMVLVGTFVGDPPGPFAVGAQEYHLPLVWQWLHVLLVSAEPSEQPATNVHGGSGFHDNSSANGTRCPGR